MTSVLPMPPTLRPRFVEAQILGADDLEGDQEYLIAVRRRHLLSGHTPGVVVGLNLTPVDGGISVSPGVAVDGYGRELVVSTATQLPQPSTDLAIYVSYRRAVSSPADPSHPRWVELVDPSAGALQDSPAPAVDLTDLPLDRDAPPWPVLLGVYQPNNNNFDFSRRQTASGVGSAICDPRRTVSIHFDRSGAVSVTSARWDSPALEVVRSGATLIHNGVIGGSVTSRLAVTLNRCQPPTAAQPWSLYRTVPPPPPSTTPAGPAQTPSEQLRIEAPAPPAGPDPAQRAVTFGTFNGTTGYDRKVSVLTLGAVVVTGDLLVTGRLATGPVPADPSTPEFQQLLVNQWVRSAAAAGTALEELYTGALALTDPQITRDDRQVTVTVHVRNVGAVQLDSVAVRADITVGGVPSPPPVDLESGLTLSLANPDHVVTKIIDVRGPERVDIVFHATGLGPKGETVSAPDLNVSNPTP